jgi:hypothetical protein
MFDVIVGTFLPVSIEDYRMVGSCIVVGLCDRPLVVTEEVYWWLVERKFRLRVHSIDEVLRKEMPQMTDEIGKVQKPAVHRYTDEGPIHVNTVKHASKVRRP